MGITWWKRGSSWVSLFGLAWLVALGCSGARPTGGEARVARTADTEIVLLSFAAVQGELLECG